MVGYCARTREPTYHAAALKRDSGTCSTIGADSAIAFRIAAFSDWKALRDLATNCDASEVPLSMIRDMGKAFLVVGYCARKAAIRAAQRALILASFIRVFMV